MRASAREFQPTAPTKRWARTLSEKTQFTPGRVFFPFKDQFKAQKYT